MSKERRILEAKYDIESRADGKKYISFYAIVFNVLSRNMGGWYERILPEAVVGADFKEWCVKKNHDANLLLGASWSGTATYEVDSRGVKCTVLAGNTSVWKDTIEEIDRGDLNFASFEFSLNNEGTSWGVETQEGIEIEVRNVKSIKKIWDLSPVVVPAYLGTEGIDVAKREFESFQRSEIEPVEVAVFNEAEILGLSLNI
jgi:uncharacterized protein